MYTISINEKERTMKKLNQIITVSLVTKLSNKYSPMHLLPITPIFINSYCSPQKIF